LPATPFRGMGVSRAAAAPLQDPGRISVGLMPCAGGPPRFRSRKGSRRTEGSDQGRICRKVSWAGV